MTLTAAVTAIASVVASVTGIKAAPATPQENINERVFALTYLMTNMVEISETGTKQNLATIAIDLLTPIVYLSENIATLLPLVDSLSTAIITEATTGGDMFSNAIDTFSNLRVEFLPYYQYAGLEYIGYRLMLENVKQKINL